MTTAPSFAIAGVAGRMGRQLTAAILDAGHSVTGGTVSPNSVHLAHDIGRLSGRDRLGIKPVTNAAQAASGADIWVDFTTPAATLSALEALKNTAVSAIIIGTTGFDLAERAAILKATDKTTIVMAGNFSLGVTLLAELTQQAANRLGENWDIEIDEMHHRQKQDAPSGTALALGEAAAKGRGAELAELQAAPYDGMDVRMPGKIGFSVRRGGGVIGQHGVTFASRQELVTLGHVALDRSVFAEGALHAALWAIDQEPGLYSMADVLGF